MNTDAIAFGRKVKKFKKVRMLKRYNVDRRGIHDGSHFPESVAAFGRESSAGVV
jgi:hypothetical protein